MLAVHWAPVSNTKHILKNGITRSGNGLYCFPLTGHKSLDRWWLYFFNQCRVRKRKQYNGFVFRLRQQDMPAYFGYWMGATTRDDFDKKITDIKKLTAEYRATVLSRLGEQIGSKINAGRGIFDGEKLWQIYDQLAETEIAKSPKALTDSFNNLGLMTHTLEDYQIVLSHSISPDRIIKILPQGNEFGKVLRRRKLDKTITNKKHEGH